LFDRFELAAKGIELRPVQGAALRKKEQLFFSVAVRMYEPFEHPNERLVPLIARVGGDERAKSPGQHRMLFVRLLKRGAILEVRLQDGEQKALGEQLVKADGSRDSRDQLFSFRNRANTSELIEELVEPQFLALEVFNRVHGRLAVGGPRRDARCSKARRPSTKRA
jgi:hypothetical protein